jgi:hydrogenase maturation protease
MIAPNAEPISPILVIGIGNPSRGDDAIGSMAVELLESQGIPGVELITDFQLQVEHALDLVGRRAVVFVDACVNASRAFSFEAVSATGRRHALSHAISPAAVLDAYRAYTREAPPSAHVLAIRGFDFGLGKPLSAASAANLDAALAMLVEYLWGQASSAQPARCQRARGEEV